MFQKFVPSDVDDTDVKDKVQIGEAGPSMPASQRGHPPKSGRDILGAICGEPCGLLGERPVMLHQSQAPEAQDV